MDERLFDKLPGPLSEPHARDSPVGHKHRKALTGKKSGAKKPGSSDTNKQSNGAKSLDLSQSSQDGPADKDEVQADDPVLADGCSEGGDTCEAAATAASVGEKRRFSDTYNPLYAFSKDDLASMDQEVDELGDTEDSDPATAAADDVDDGDKDIDEEIRRQVLNFGRPGSQQESSSSDESMSADYPRGWKKRRRKRKHSEMEGEEAGGRGERNEEEGDDGDGEDRVEDERDMEERCRLFRRREEDEDESSPDSDFADSVGSVDEEMAAAVEREFLSF